MFNFVRKSMLSAAFIVAPVILNACGGDSSSSSAGDEDVITADSTDDLPNCTKSREGTKAVTEEGSFVCVDGTWEPERKRFLITTPKKISPTALKAGKARSPW